MNSLFNDFKPQQNNPMNNFLNQFNQFKSTFTGNPEQQVKQLLSSGRMSQEQFNQLAQTANQLRQLIK
jgi:ABC-type transporter Mla subunit MlaD